MVYWGAEAKHKAFSKGQMGDRRTGWVNAQQVFGVEVPCKTEPDKHSISYFRATVLKLYPLGGGGKKWSAWQSSRYGTVVACIR